MRGLAVTSARNPKKMFFCALVVIAAAMSFCFAPCAYAAGTYNDVEVKMVRNNEPTNFDNFKVKAWGDLGDDGIYFDDIGSPEMEPTSDTVYKDGSVLKLKAGEKSGSYRLLWKNKGVTSDGVDVDLRLKVRVTIKQLPRSGSGYNPVDIFSPNWFNSYDGLSTSDKTGAAGVMQSVTVDYLDSKTGKKVDGSAMWLFKDIDVTGFGDSYGDPYSESIELVSGIGDNVYIGEKLTSHYSNVNNPSGSASPGGVLQQLHGVSDSSNLLIRASHVCANLTDSSFATTIECGGKFIWRGIHCGTHIGIFEGKPTATHYTPEITKIALGDPTKRHEFTFRIKEVDGIQDYTGGNEKRIDTSGTVKFDKQTYKKAGDYVYKINEVLPASTAYGSDGGWIHDDREMTLTVKVRARNGEYYVKSATYSRDGKFTNMYVTGPEKVVDKAISYETGTLHYTVTQNIPAQPSERFIRSLRFEDVLPKQVEYVPHTFKVTAFGNDVFDTAGILSTSNQHLRYNFDNSWVSAMSAAGGDITFEFDAKIIDAKVGSIIINRAKTFINDWTLTSNPATTVVDGWYLDVLKQSSYPDIMAGNPLYSLSGAVFEVRDELDHLYGTLETDAEGKTRELTIGHPGTYRIIEVMPPLGHRLSEPNVQTVTLDEGNLGRGSKVTTTFTNDPLFACDEFDYIAVKTDSDYYFGAALGENAEHLKDSKWWQGNAPDFSACKVRVSLFARGANVNTAAPLASAVFRADSLGRIAFADAAPVDGTTWRYRFDGRNIMPLGHVVVTEVNPPVGYVLNGESHEAMVVQDETSTGVVILGLRRWVELDWDRVFDRAE